MDGLGGSLYRRPESVPTAAVDKNGEPPFSSLQDVGRRRALVDELADKLGLLQR